MMTLLFGNWTRRIVTSLVCLLAFAVSLTAALTVAIGRNPDSAASAQKVPVLGGLSVNLAHTTYGKPPAPEVEEVVPTVRELRPLTAEEIATLMESLKEQRQTYVAKSDELSREIKRMELYRSELNLEREQLMALRETVVSQWEDIKRAREALEKQWTEMSQDESKNLKQLATAYESMRPDQAAAIVKELDEAMATKTLYLMKERAAAKVLESLDHETAAKLTERMALLRQVN